MFILISEMAVNVKFGAPPTLAMAKGQPEIAGRLPHSGA